MVQIGGDSGYRKSTSEKNLGGDVHQLGDAYVQERKMSGLTSGTEPE